MSEDELCGALYGRKMGIDPTARQLILDEQLRRFSSGEAFWRPALEENVVITGMPRDLARCHWN
jgi:hypothetical protein